MGLNETGKPVGLAIFVMHYYFSPKHLIPVNPVYLLLQAIGSEKETWEHLLFLTLTKP